MTLYIAAVFLTAATAIAITPCKLSIDCGDADGRTLCYQGQCHRDVPCNKDNDCFFYGASDVASGQFHPACFVGDNIAPSQDGYGVCMVREAVEHANSGLSRLPGSDVEDVMIKVTVN